jgi:hypothetical protein
MPDITMCDNQKCSRRDKCYRATAEPSYYQSWCIFNENSPDYHLCEHFIERVIHTKEPEKATEF